MHPVHTGIPAIPGIPGEVGPKGSRGEHGMIGAKGAKGDPGLSVFQSCEPNSSVSIYALNQWLYVIRN